MRFGLRASQCQASTLLPAHRRLPDGTLHAVKKTQRATQCNLPLGPRPRLHRACLRPSAADRVLSRTGRNSHQYTGQRFLGHSMRGSRTAHGFAKRAPAAITICGAGRSLEGRWYEQRPVLGTPAAREPEASRRNGLRRQDGSSISIKRDGETNIQVVPIGDGGLNGSNRAVLQNRPAAER